MHSQTDHHDQQILVADDDASIRTLLVRLLQRTGYSFKEAKNGREALAEMRSSDISLVLLDLMMPDVSGWDVLAERARELDLQKIPVIVITASTGEKVTKVLDRGVCALLPKPFELRVLMSVVENCLEQSANGDRSQKLSDPS